ncbi:hypothetical protein TRAPUB_5055 [Trametes pubescens]|uniref:Cytochrome P450 n=1 Tax=Trametes pubescens TaxID=154538 RepID=A0A1M2V9N2_TRAPU|nr:hypothetical protein TRAPUB_5055 [Trametes pubescens]
MVDYLLSFGFQFALAVMLILCIVLAWALLPVLWWRLKSPLRRLPGPPSAHWLYGNLGDVYDARKSMFLDEWSEKYGPAVRFGGFLNLRDVWAREATDGYPAYVNVLKGLSRVTLDAIGLAGFGHDIGALSPGKADSELAKAFEDIFDVPKRIPALAVLQTIFPTLECLSNNIMRRFDYAHSIMRRIGRQSIADKKASMAVAPDEKNTIPFLATGHESTSTATAWCLFALTQAPRVQETLRDEVLAVTTANPTMDELIALPYLNMVIRETLRLHPPIASTMRVATKEDAIPLSTSFKDMDGNVHSSIRVSEGTPILIPILAINTSRTIWGEDAHEFKPERWEDPPQPTANIPGVWAHTLSFLGGPRACIGYRLSLVEMKALVFTLVRAFEFSLAVDPSQVTKMPGILQRPLVETRGGRASQLPLFVKRYTRREVY